MPSVGKPRAATRADRCVAMTSSNSLSNLSEIKFLTVAEVAAVMRVSRMTVYRLVHASELASVRVGRSFRVPENAVHDYLRGAFTEAG
jgi:excisionase family DNA binding protein